MHKVVKSNLVLFQNRCLVSGVSRQDVVHGCADERIMQATTTAVGYTSMLVPLKLLLNKEHRTNKFQAMVALFS